MKGKQDREKKDDFLLIKENFYYDTGWFSMNLFREFVINSIYLVANHKGLIFYIYINHHQTW